MIIHPTYSKASVGYSQGMTNAHCAICIHYLGNGACEKVKGLIRPDDWCKLFKKDD